MKTRIKTLGVLLIGLNVGGAIGCNEGNNPFLKKAFQVGRVQIQNCPATPLQIDEQEQLDTVAYDSQGNPIPTSNVVYQYERPAIDEGRFILNGDLVEAKYPGQGAVTATMEGVVSPPCMIQVEAPQNLGQLIQLTNNSSEDHWGMNNNWGMISNGHVLWQNDDGVNTTVMLHNLQDLVGTDEKLMMTPTDVDFMALGSGAQNTDFLASWRVGLSDTWISTVGGSPQNLGPQLQEENSIADGTLLFRHGLPFNDIFSYSQTGGLSPLAQNGDLSNPIASGGQAVWLEDQGGGNSNLIYFDGTNLKTVATGPFAPGRFDFRHGRAVYSQNNEVFLFDAATGQTQNLTPGSPDLHSFVKTDGQSVLLLRTLNGSADQEVVLYNIAAGNSSVISTTPDPKDGNSLQIDLKQAIWVEGNDLYFHNGSGDANGTSVVPLGNAALDLNYHPYLSNGAVAWVGNDGNDTEIFVME